MPTYQYKCSSCSHSFENIVSVASRFEATQHPCPNCGKEESVVLCVVSPLLVSRVGDNLVSRTDSRFRENLKRIKENNPGSTIDI